MTTQPAAPADHEQTLLVLGASGDLTGRLLLPGLGGLLAESPGEKLFLVGSGKDDWTDEHWRQRVTEAFSSATGPQVTATVQSTRYLQADVTRQEDLERLLAECRGPVIIFFALPPAVTAKACQALTGVELPEGTRLVLEKPFGVDTASARRSTSCWPRSYRRSGSTGSTTSWASRPYSTSWVCDSRTGCSNRC